MKILPFLKRFRISTQLIFWFLLVALIPLAIVTTLAVSTARTSMQKEVSARLLAIANAKAEQIETYIQTKRSDVARLAQSPDVIRSIDEYARPFAQYGLHSKEYLAVDQEIRPYFAYYQEEVGYYDIFLISENGDIVFTVEQEDDLGTNLLTGEYSETGLAQVFKRAQTLLETDISQFEFYLPSQEPAAFIAAPVFSDGRFVGAVAVQLSNDHVYGMMYKNAGLGDTGETIVAGLVNDEIVFAAPTRFDENAALNRQVSKGSPAAIPFQDALSGTRGMGLVKDYRGKDVLAVWQYLPSLRWGMIVKVDSGEVFSLVKIMISRIVWATLLVSLVVISGAYFVAGVIAGPIARMSEQATRVAEGDLKVTLPEDDSRDEVGLLTRAFNKMTANLQHVMNDLETRRKAEQESKEFLETIIREYVAVIEKTSEGDLTQQVAVSQQVEELGILGDNLNIMISNLRQLSERSKQTTMNLTSATTEIMASTSEQAATAAQQAAAVSQTSATIIEARQTAEQAADRARLVSEMAEQSLEVSNQGLARVQASTAGMVAIKEQVSTIAETILSLSEQTQQISAIIATVNDIADQSNLLALNAAMEAARAGEAGRGFAVVAGEVRSLAEQSRQATRQVREILGEIQKAANTAVMVTEEGAKRAEEGVGLAESTGDVITTIRQHTQKVAQAAQQIAASTNQQLAGMDQIAAAMENINQATVQTEMSTRQVEGTAQNLNELAAQLSRVVEQYRLE